MEQTQIEKIIKFSVENKDLCLKDPFILQIEGSLHLDVIENKIVHGEAIEIVIEEGSPESSQKSGYIPLSNPTIIIQCGKDWEEIYVFNKKGWQHIPSY
jgi:hypothetical protein